MIIIIIIHFYCKLSRYSQSITLLLLLSLSLLLCTYNTPSDDVIIMIMTTIFIIIYITIINWHQSWCTIRITSSSLWCAWYIWYVKEFKLNVEMKTHRNVSLRARFEKEIAIKYPIFNEIRVITDHSIKEVQKASCHVEIEHSICLRLKTMHVINLMNVATFWVFAHVVKDC